MLYIFLFLILEIKGFNMSINRQKWLMLDTIKTVIFRRIS